MWGEAFVMGEYLCGGRWRGDELGGWWIVFSRGGIFLRKGRGAVGLLIGVVLYL
ncbi:hypothetical protein [Bartonella sp. CL25QHWL]|uniref:hypothetical protein n=1 Tax=Bartonella sp. CL25QHWL TaxID=3243518 RepID=UPI0035CF7C79